MTSNFSYNQKYFDHEKVIYCCRSFRVIIQFLFSQDQSDKIYQKDAQKWKIFMWIYTLWNFQVQFMFEHLKVNVDIEWFEYLKMNVKNDRIISIENV